MESLGKDHAYSDSSLPSSAAHEEPAVPDVIITRRLRDREQLRKRQAEAQENDLIQWLLREQRNKRQRRGRRHAQLLKPVKSPGREQTSKQQRRGRRARQGRGHQQVVKLSPKPEPELDSQPDSQQEAEPGPSNLALPELAYQEELPVLTIQDVARELQPEVEEGEPAARSQDPAGEEEVLQLAEGEIPEAWNMPLENDQQDISSNTGFLF